MLTDKIINGAIIGTVGAVVQELYGLILLMFGYQGLTYPDYGRTLLSLDPHFGILGYGLGLIAHLIWDIIVGIVFVHLIHWSSEIYLHWKGIIYGPAVWFLIQAGFSLLRFSELLKDYPRSEPFIFIGSLLYGLVAGFTYTFLLKYRIHSGSGAVPEG